MSLMQRGFTRLLIDGKTVGPDVARRLDRPNFDNVFVLVDRLVARPTYVNVWFDSLETCFQEGHGSGWIETAEATPRRLKFSDRLNASMTATLYEQPEPSPFQL